MREHPIIPEGVDVVRLRRMDKDGDAGAGHKVGTPECRSWADANGEHPHIVTVDRVGTPILQVGVACSCGDTIVPLMWYDTRNKPSEAVMEAQAQRDADAADRHYGTKHGGQHA